MKPIQIALVAAGFLCSISSSAQREKTAFQVSDAWSEDYDVRSDVAIVYGINDAGGNFEQRVKSWKDKGYQVHFMTGIAWGQYKDYFLGEFDGRGHLDEGQVTRKGDTIWHGHLVPYLVPSDHFLAYMKTHVKRAIDAGCTGIYLEEPEFWARAGYSTAFQKEWKKYYGSDWHPQHESPQATYMSAKLKYQLYYNALKEVFSYVKSYSESQGKKVRCYVPTHSLLNYSSWHIVSPEASLASLPGMDGYIAQVWTGTSREPVFFNGQSAERVFENAFLEYGSMVSMTAPTGKKMFFLTDPIEDRAKSWDDYKRNYQATFTAQLLYPMVSDYEVMPWPPRIYRGKFKVESTGKREPISPAYATQMQVMVNALNEMPKSDNKVSGSHGIGVLVSNTMMFQNFPTHENYDDPYLSNFYGMAMPLLERGVPVETVHMENLGYPNTLKEIRVLSMSYSNMKPQDSLVHERLNKWVRNGGTLIYSGRDNDPFQKVQEWWNTGSNSYAAPSQHLFRLLEIDPPAKQPFYKVGKGRVYLNEVDPKELIMKTGGDQAYVKQVAEAYQNAAGQAIRLKNSFILNRGPYIVAAGLDALGDTTGVGISGPMIDLFDPELPIVQRQWVVPGHQYFLYKLNALTKETKPKVLAAAARVYEEKLTGKRYSFVTKSPANTNNIMRILLPAKPSSVELKKGGDKMPYTRMEWDAGTKTLLLGYPNYSEGVQVSVNW